jgi:hypothetical protein
MADVARALMEDLDCETLGMQKVSPDCGYGKTAAALGCLAQYRKRLSFAVYHVNDMAAALRRRYEKAA